MTVRRALTALAVITLIAVPAVAGGPGCEKGSHAAVKASAKKCTMSADECRQHLAEARSRGWVGIELDKSEAGTMTVTRVVPNSPAVAAGFREGDVLVAMNGIALTEANHDKLKAAKQTLKPGSTVVYTVARDGEERQLQVALATMPDAVYTAMVDEHMKEHEGSVAAR